MVAYVEGMRSYPKSISLSAAQAEICRPNKLRIAARDSLAFLVAFPAGIAVSSVPFMAVAYAASLAPNAPDFLVGAAGFACAYKGYTIARDYVFAPVRAKIGEGFKAPVAAPSPK